MKASVWFQISVGSNLKILNLEPTEPPKSEPLTYQTSCSSLKKPNLEPNQVQPNTILFWGHTCGPENFKYQMVLKSKIKLLGDAFSKVSFKKNTAGVILKSLAGKS